MVVSDFTREVPVLVGRVVDRGCTSRARAIRSPRPVMIATSPLASTLPLGVLKHHAITIRIFECHFVLMPKWVA